MKSVNIILSLSFLILSACGEDLRRNGKHPATPIVAPILTDAPDVIASGMHHNPNPKEQIKTSQEISLTLSHKLPSDYRLVPDMSKDDEAPRVLARPKIECGDTDFKGVKARIDDCASKNVSTSYWEGRVQGKSAEGNWRLVAFTSNKKEIWLDSRTGLVWSDLVGTGNWCQASGNTQAAASDSPYKTDCASLAAGISLCNGAVLEGIKEISWRLPTRNDFLQAEIDGLRSVTGYQDANPFWTATIDSTVSGRNFSWGYNQSTGTLVSVDHHMLGNVRCVGAPKL